MDAKADFIVIGELDKTPSEQAREQAASNSRAMNDENSGAQGVRDGRRLSAFWLASPLASCSTARKNQLSKSALD